MLFIFISPRSMAPAVGLLSRKGSTSQQHETLHSSNQSRMTEDEINLAFDRLEEHFAE